MGKKNIIKAVKDHCEPIVEGLGYDLVDVEYIKENNRFFLRFYIGKPEGITIDDCQIVSEKVGVRLDELNLIQDSYYLEVSSPGLDRPLETDKDLKRNIGKNVEVSLYKVLDGKKNYIGELLDFSHEYIIIKANGSGPKEIEREFIANIKLSIDF